MELYRKIREDLRKAMRESDLVKTEALRIVIGEFPRLNKKAGETPTDEEILQILNTLRKNEKITLEAQNCETSAYLKIIESYLPKMMHEYEILAFIQKEIDLTQYKNKMQAMKPIMQQLKGKADGAVVKKILNNL